MNEQQYDPVVEAIRALARRGRELMAKFEPILVPEWRRQGTAIQRWGLDSRRLSTLGGTGRAPAS